MDRAKIKSAPSDGLHELPGKSGEKAKQNRLPKHLRPPEIWPIWIQIVLNIWD